LPGGAPGWLNPFLVLVESVRIFVRPITISVRLVANMRAGHVVLCLIGIYCVCYFFLSWYLFLIILVVQISYIMFELGIGGIQSYIFRLLMSLYADDHGA
jgi:F-type H+-transporting ATPase subunit a